MSSFHAELRPLVGRIITVATQCGSITGRLMLVGIDKIVIRTATARFIIRILKICWVRRINSDGWSPCRRRGCHRRRPHERYIVW
ncbi:MAG: DUF2642 domain-containing protein [Symbiobacteriia bacterium]